MEQLFAEVEQKIQDVDVVSPYSQQGARQVARNGKIAYAEVNFADRSGEELTDAGKEIKQFAEKIDVPGLTVEFGGDVFADPQVGGASEGIGIARGDDHPAHRVRFGARDGSADRHRAVRHRHRHRDSC